MKAKTVANVLEETEEYTKYKFGRLICLPSPLKLAILPNNQFEYYQVEYFKKYSNSIK